MPDRVTPADFDELHTTLALSFGGGAIATPSLHTFAATSPHGVSLVQRRAGRIVATAAGFGFGATAWIGGVTVRPDARGERLAETLTAAVLDALGPRETVSLLATDAGRRTYERLGFEPEGVHRTFAPARPTAGDRGDAADGARPAARAESDGPRVRRATPDEHATVLALDRRVTGEDRRALLEWGLGDTLVTDDLRGAAIGLPVANSHVVAETPAAGAALLAARLAEGRRHTVPVANAAAVEALAGREPQQDTVRMRLGTPLPVRHDAVWGTATLFCA